MNEVVCFGDAKLLAGFAEVRVFEITYHIGGPEADIQFRVERLRRPAAPIERASTDTISQARELCV